MNKLIKYLTADDKVMRTNRMKNTTRTSRTMPDDCEADEADKGGRCGGRRRRGHQDISLPMRTWKRRQAEEDEMDGPDEDDEADEEKETP